LLYWLTLLQLLQVRQGKNRSVDLPTKGANQLGVTHHAKIEKAR